MNVFRRGLILPGRSRLIEETPFNPSCQGDFRLHVSAAFIPYSILSSQF